MRTSLKILAIITTVILVGILSTYLWYQNALQPVSNTETFHSVIIPKGSSATKVADLLKQEKLIKNPLAFRFYTKLHQSQTNLRAGQFRLSTSWSIPQIIDHLSRGGFQGIWVTFIEGWRREQIVQELAQNLPSATFSQSEFLQLTQDLEGHLFPDTYLIPETTTAAQITRLLTDTFTTKTQPLLASATTVPHPFTFQQAVILASILDRETATPADYPIVAGILIKRYQNNWPLQADATLQYAKVTNQLAANSYKLTAINDWWPTPTVADKDINSSYNTYTHPGLPPAPISNPSLTALKAALDPTETDYWYYLTDNQGRMHYSKTLEEHNQNVEKYLK